MTVSSPCTTLLLVTGHHVVSTHLAPHLPPAREGGGRDSQRETRETLLLPRPGEYLLLRPVEILPEMSEPLLSVPVRGPAVVGEADLLSAHHLTVRGSSCSLLESPRPP